MDILLDFTRLPVLARIVIWMITSMMYMVTHIQIYLREEHHLKRVGIMWFVFTRRLPILPVEKTLKLSNI